MFERQMGVASVAVIRSVFFTTSMIRSVKYQNYNPQKMADTSKDELMSS